MRIRSPSKLHPISHTDACLGGAITRPASTQVEVKQRPCCFQYICWGDERTDLCCAGVPRNSIIAVGSHGYIKLLQERPYFINGLDYAVRKLRPKIIIVYGTAPDYICDKYRGQGIKILQFDSDYMVTHRKAVSACTAPQKLDIKV